MTIRPYSLVPHEVVRDLTSSFTPWEAAQLWADIHEYGYNNFAGGERTLSIRGLMVSVKYLDRDGSMVRWNAPRLGRMAAAVFQG